MFDSMERRRPTVEAIVRFLPGVAVLVGFYAVSRCNYLLFHNMVETFAAFMAVTVFVLFWNTRRFLNNGFFLFIGIACLFTGIFDLLHLWTYKGTSVFPGAGGEESIQLKTAGRWIASLSFLASPFFFRRRLNVAVAIGGYTAIFVAALYTVFWEVFPDCYIPGLGMTDFEQFGRTLSCVAFLAAVALLVRKRSELDPYVFRLLLVSWLAGSASEFCSSVAVDFVGVIKVLAHLFEVASLYLIYKAFVEVGLRNPYELVFRSLKRSEEAAQQQQQFLETVLDTVRTGIVACDANGVLTLFNRAAREVHGRVLEPVPANQWAQYYGLYEADGKTLMRTQDLPLVRALTGEEVRDAVLTIMSKGQPPRTLQADGRPLYDKDGRKTSAVVATNDITERKLAEKALQESEAKLRLLLDSTAEAIYGVDLHGCCSFCNRASLRLLGYERPEELLGRNMHGQIHHSHADGTHFAVEECQIVRALREEENTHTDSEVFWRKDGTSFPAEYWSYPQRKDGEVVGAVVTFVDISDRKQMEEAIAHENAKLQGMTSGMDEGVVFADTNNVIVEVNEYLCRFVGRDRRDILGKRLEDIHHGESLDRLSGQIERFRKQAGSGAMVIQRPLAGAEVIMRMQPIYRDGKYDGVLMNVIDVSELVKVRREAEAANQAKSRFLATMSHEIRTPMTAILGYVDLLTDSTLGPSGRNNYLAVIRRNGEHLLALINDILDLSKIEAGKMSWDMSRCNIVSLLADVADAVRPRVERRNVSLSVEYPGEVPETILTDIGHLRQALINLAGNAVKFTERGGVRIVTSFLPEWRQGQPAMKIEVIDTGIGIRQEVLLQLFEPFVQGDVSISQKFGGTGLGLAISRHIAQVLGGELSATSVFGQGSTFSLIVPTGSLEGVAMLRPPAEAESEAADNAGDSNGGNLDGVRILLAEDGFDNQRLIKTILEAEGAEVVTVENGRLALAKAESEPFGLILMDMNMPEMDGYAAARALRDRGYAKPIVALTANAMLDDSQRCLAAGCSEYLSKPINRMQLIRTIAMCVGKPAGAGEPTPGPTKPSPAAEDGPIVSEFADDPEIAEILGGFVGRLAGQVEAMRAGCESGRHDELRRLAHKLRGAGGSYGYPCLTEACGRLEDAAKASNAPAETVALDAVASISGRIQEGCAQLVGVEGASR